MGFDFRRSGLSASLWFPLFLTFLGILWLAGGASRADVVGQAVVRGSAIAAMIAVVLFAERPTDVPDWPVLALLLAALALVLAQLVPLPAGLWAAMPGRAMLMAANAGDPVTRPLSIVPGATANAAASLFVPLATFALVMAAGHTMLQRTATALLTLIGISTLQGALQFAGVHVDNPLINDPMIDVVGPFANRNHFALLLALGCVLVPVWAFLPHRPQRWRAPVAIMSLPLFLLIALATGSRAGIVLCCVGLVLGLAISFRPLRARLRHKPAWVMPALIGGIVVIGIILVVASIASDRAVAVNRALSVDVETDIRLRGLPTVLTMIGQYMPLGAGFGGFDPMFRIHEPFALLKPTYFNHAHNDILEIALDGGIPALVLLAVCVGWWLLATIRAWRTSLSSRVMLARLGSAMLGLIFVASVVDYPARTPLIMAIIVLAAIWLSNSAQGSGRSALPTQDRHL